MHISRLNIRKRSLGVYFNQQGEAEITVWAPLIGQVAIMPEKNNQEIPLEKSDDGYWTLTTTEISPGDLYKIRLNDEKLFPDPVSLSQPLGVHGASRATDLSAFKWTDLHWLHFPLKDYIIYELHTGVFTPEAMFEGIERKLDYLLQLGVNAIEIMPVAQFPGARNWGYDGVYPFAVQDSYGGAAGLQQLVNACHDKGIAVILDVVYNHIGPEGNYLPEFGPYFTSKYGTPWGKAVNVDDEWCDGVRHYILENVLMWFRDFHIDALRMDAVHALKDFGAKNILLEIKEATDALMKASHRSHHLIVECDLNDVRYINPAQLGGYGMDAQWIDEFHHALRIAAGGENHGYYSDFNGIQHLTKAYKDAYVYDGFYSPHRKKTFGSKAGENHRGDHFIVFSQNHDQVGNRMMGERSSVLMSYEMQKLMAGAVMVSPYIPMLFMGEEYGETNPFLYFVSHTDPSLREMVREGRRKEFEAFHLQGEAPDPSDEETFTKSRLQWQLADEPTHSTLLSFYKKLIALRKENIVLRNMSREKLEVVCSELQQTIMLHRWEEDQHLLCLLNFSRKEQPVTLTDLPGQRKLLFNSASPEWNGPAEAEAVPGSIIFLPPESFIIYV